MMQENPLIPMAAVTGRPSREFIRYFMGEYRRVGITQFLLYPRSGCEVEYLSEEWFTMVQNVIDAAEKLGFTSLWLYDEFNWPSGQGGGRVMAESPDFMLHYLQAKRDENTGEVAFTVQRMEKYPNLLNPESVEFFLQTTHEEYARRFGKYFGTLIKGIFTDEPSIGYFWGHNEFDQPDDVRMAWYPELEQEYLARTGRELRDDIRAHFDGTFRNGFRKDYETLVGMRFRKTFFDRIRSWCDAHCILLTGHLMGEHGAQAPRYNGDTLLANAGFSLPGMDEIHTGVGGFDVEWQTFGTVQYGARQRGNGALAELFALGPATLSPSYYRQMIWLTALFGVDHYLLAVAQFGSEGNAHKPTWYHPTSPAQTWFDHYDQLGEEARKAAQFAHREVRPDIEIRYANHSPLQVALLRQLVHEQHPWRFLRADDAPSSEALVVLETLSDGSLRDEKSGVEFSDADTLINWLRKHCSQRVRVFSHGSILAEDVFVQNYMDGTSVVLDLRDPVEPPRKLLLRFANEAASRSFVLEASGVAVVKQENAVELVSTPSSVLMEGHQWNATSGKWRLVGLDRPSLLCPEFDAQNSVRLEIAPGVGPLRIMVRQYGTPATVRLDGREIRAEGTCASLPQGFNHLYRASDEMTLDPTAHSLELSGTVKDYPFLPSVFLVGEFAVFCEAPGAMRLTPLPSELHDGDLTTQGLRSYAGTVTLEQAVEVPANAKWLHLDTGTNCASVSLDGHDLGVRCWAPFAWPVPADMRGRTVLLTATLELPVGWIFGRERLDGKAWQSPRHILPPGLYRVEWM
ncbi:MAG: hypothetical protein IJT83_16515 [Victivallales bacterium]|nr:hypothetical protein [Victivallales bacterium]